METTVSKNVLWFIVLIVCIIFVSAILSYKHHKKNYSYQHTTNDTIYLKRTEAVKIIVGNDTVHIVYEK